MKHLDSGQLHAYLDGQRAALDGTERNESEQHLAECAACRGRLEEERRLREQARSILAGAGPKGLTPPPFDAVVERAARRQKTRRGIRPATWLAWAASVALALTVGWYARGLVSIGAGGTARQVAAAGRAEQEVQAAPIRAVPPTSKQLAQAAPGRRDVPQRANKSEGDTGQVTGLAAPAPPPTASLTVAEAKVTAEAEARPRPQAQAQAPAPSVAAQRIFARGAEAGAPQTGSITGQVVGAITQQPLADVAVLVEGTGRRGVTGPDGRFRLADVPAGPQRLRAALVGYGTQQQAISVLAGDTATVQVALEPQSVALDEVVVAGTAESWITVPPSEAARRLGGPLATIPGLPSLGTAVSGTGASAMARTLQVLGPGLTVELVQSRAEPAAGEPGQALTVQWEGFSVTGHALVPRDSLRRLLQRLTAAGSSPR